MSTVTNEPGSDSRALPAAWFSLTMPLVMVCFAALLPKDDPPLHPVNNSWYLHLTSLICILAIASAGWALRHRIKGSGGIAAIAIIGAIVSAIVGFLAFCLASIHGLHT